MIPDLPEEFVYDYDMDENGLMYFLGTFGHRKMWQNPHLANQVTCFGTSCGSNVNGNIWDIVGRSATNFKTINEKDSHVGFDLGPDRLF